jgi:hypothetical protein
VSGVYQRLPPEARARTALFAQNYGEAGALDWLGRTHGLPSARSGHNNYYLWGPGDEPENVLVVGGRLEDLQPLASGPSSPHRCRPTPT